MRMVIRRATRCGVRGHLLRLRGSQRFSDRSHGKGLTSRNARRDEDHAAFFFCVGLKDWRSMLRRYKGIKLIAKNGYFGSGDFQAHQAVIRIEEQEYLEIGRRDAQAVVGFAVGGD